MNILSKLLGTPSPFEALLLHLEKVMETVDLIPPIIEAALNDDGDKVEEISHTIFRLEHEADQIKTSIRDNLPRDLLLPVSRIDFLAFLREQDSLADKAEDLAMMLSIRKLSLPDSCGERNCKDELRHLASHAVEAAKTVASMTRRITDLRQHGFKGNIADEMREVAAEVGNLEWKADKHQYRLLKTLLRQDDQEWPFVNSYTLMQVITALGKLANHAESMADYLRLMIAE